MTPNANKENASKRKPGAEARPARETVDAADDTVNDAPNELPDDAAANAANHSSDAVASVKNVPTSTPDERLLVALHVADEKKAHDTVVLDLRPVASFTDFFVITSGANQRQVQAIADEVSFRLKRMGTPVIRTEGYTTAEWVLLDFGDFVMHVFDQKARGFFDLERLWRDASRLNIPASEIAATGSRIIAEQEKEYAERKAMREAE